jgi:glycosyltransferase involved in cell wall biosynthesis
LVASRNCDTTQMSFMITLFTPSFADEANTNAQNLTAKEVVSRLPADQFRVILLGDGAPDPRIRDRENTEILPCRSHGNTARWLTRVLTSKIDIYFFPRQGPLDSLFLFFRRSLGLPIALVTYIVMALDETTVGTTMTRSIREADCVLGNSHFVAKTVKDRFGVETGTIYSGIKRDLFHPPIDRCQHEAKLTVLYAGSFQARKRVNVVIGEAAKWPAVEFRLVGKGEEEDKCRSLVSALGCRNVTFVGHLSQKQLAEEMRKADLFLFPSVLEGRHGEIPARLCCPWRNRVLGKIGGGALPYAGLAAVQLRFEAQDVRRRRSACLAIRLGQSYS